MGSWEPGRGRAARVRAGRLDAALAWPARVHRPRRQARPTARPRAAAPDGKVCDRRGGAHLAHASRRGRRAGAARAGDRRPGRERRASAQGDRRSAPAAGCTSTLGSATDACRDAAGKQPMPCPEVAGPSAARRGLGGDARPPRRRSRCRRMRAVRQRPAQLGGAAPCVAGADVLLQGENSIDYRDAAAPPEELERAARRRATTAGPTAPARGAGARLRRPRSTASRPRRRRGSGRPHAAPLQMLAVPAGAATPSPASCVVAWHGYRRRRRTAIVGHALDAQGRPQGAPHGLGRRLDGADRRAAARRADRHRGRRGRPPADRRGPQQDAADARPRGALSAAATIAPMLEFTVLSTEGQARRGRLVLNRGSVQTPVFMPVGTYGSVKGVMPQSLEAMGAEIILGNTFHLWLRPGLDVLRALRRPASLRGLDPADPDRQRRLPGLVARRQRQGQRAGRRLPVAGQRRQAAADARGQHADPARARQRHRHAVRRMHRLAEGRRGRARGAGAPLDGDEPALGQALAGRVRPAGEPERAVRHRPGRHVREPARGVGRRAWPRSTSRATRSAASASASRRRRCSGSSPTRRTACRRASRAT